MSSIIEERLSAEKVVEFISKHEANKKALKSAIGGLVVGGATGSAVTSALKSDHVEKPDIEKIDPALKTLSKYSEEHPGKTSAVVAGAVLAGLAARRLLKKKERSNWGMK